MLLILRLLIFAALVVVIWKATGLVLRHRRKPRCGLKCATCAHCDLIDEDGVMCRYGDSVTLKTPAHVRNCLDYEADPKLVRRSRR